MANTKLYPTFTSPKAPCFGAPEEPPQPPTRWQKPKFHVEISDKITRAAEEASGFSLAISYTPPPEVEAKLSYEQKMFFNGLPEQEKRRLLKEGGFIPSVSYTADIALAFAKPGLSRSVGLLKQDKKHALGRTIDILKARYGPLTFKDLLAILEDPDLIEDLHLAESNPIPIRAVEVDRDEEKIRYSVIQKGKRNSASPNYKAKSIAFRQLKSYL
jgi:hypothetical protein